MSDLKQTKRWNSYSKSEFQNVGLKSLTLEFITLNRNLIKLTKTELGIPLKWN